MQIREHVTITSITTSNLKAVCPYVFVIQEIAFQKTIFMFAPCINSIKTLLLFQMMHTIIKS